MIYYYVRCLYWYWSQSPTRVLSYILLALLTIIANVNKIFNLNLHKSNAAATAVTAAVYSFRLLVLRIIQRRQKIQYENANNALFFISFSEYHNNNIFRAGFRTLLFVQAWERDKRGF